MYADIQYRRILMVLSRFGNFDELSRHQLNYLRTCVGFADTSACMSYDIYCIIHTLDSASRCDVVHYLDTNECDLAVLGECPVFADTAAEELSDVFEYMAL